MLVPVTNDNHFLGIELDLKSEIAPQLRVGASLYQQRTGHWPDKILLNPNLPEIPGIADLGVEIEAHAFVQDRKSVV